MSKIIGVLSLLFVFAAFADDYNMGEINPQTGQPYAMGNGPMIGQQYGNPLTNGTCPVSPTMAPLTQGMMMEQGNPNLYPHLQQQGYQQQQPMQYQQ